jgi:hypothetical protein
MSARTPITESTAGLPSGNPRCERSLTPTAHLRKTSTNPTETLPVAEWPGSTKVAVVRIEGYDLAFEGLQLPPPAPSAG